MDLQWLVDVGSAGVVIICSSSEPCRLLIVSKGGSRYRGARQKVGDEPHLRLDPRQQPEAGSGMLLLLAAHTMEAENVQPDLLPEDYKDTTCSAATGGGYQEVHVTAGQAEAPPGDGTSTDAEAAAPIR
ncbi:hypothetical protein PR202_gb25751 [Eleusine coracana subsp. coracana]|uniref:Uncharacterized protein n=1 Tax=Eleusine coracana subsp. coracana TaxID=191504 RepID=A0AAV5FQB7_ELECO|nr:hypothetical protein PR202_gb25751 [Eleusine coracana subsp. coracana]